MRYDLYYIKNRTLLLDLGILFRTVGIVLLGYGSAAVLRPVRGRVAVQPVPSRQ
jgi:hypothetical protein